MIPPISPPQPTEAEKVMTAKHFITAAILAVTGTANAQSPYEWTTTQSGEATVASLASPNTLLFVDYYRAYDGDCRPTVTYVMVLDYESQEEYSYRYIEGKSLLRIDNKQPHISDSHINSGFFQKNGDYSQQIKLHGQTAAVQEMIEGNALWARFDGVVYKTDGKRADAEKFTLKGSGKAIAAARASCESEPASN
jgi:hypothetical protein